MISAPPKEVNKKNGRIPLAEAGGRDASDVSSSLYFYKLRAGDYTETRRMILVK
jgi:hypothetical protein